LSDVLGVAGVVLAQQHSYPPEYDRRIQPNTTRYNCYYYRLNACFHNREPYAAVLPNIFFHPKFGPSVEHCIRPRGFMQLKGCGCCNITILHCWLSWDNRPTKPPEPRKSGRSVDSHSLYTNNHHLTLFRSMQLCGSGYWLLLLALQPR
jgi:hypothetical protein